MTELSSSLIHASANGDPKAKDDLFKTVYLELKGYARYTLYTGARGVTLSATAVVHEAWLKISVDPNLSWQDRSHFFRISAMAIRQIVVDELRRKRSQKRGSGTGTEEFDEEIHSHSADRDIVLAVNDALEELKKIEPLYNDIVECRFFAGYSEEETARILNISLRSVQRYWSDIKKRLKVSIEGG